MRKGCSGTSKIAIFPQFLTILISCERVAPAQVKSVFDDRTFISCERVAPGQVKLQFFLSFWRSDLHFVRKGCSGTNKIAIFPQYLTIDLHFVRKGWRFMTPRRHRPRPKERKKKKEREREKGEREERGEREREKMWVCGCEDVSVRERKRRCECVKMWRCECEDVRCEDSSIWRCEGVKMYDRRKWQTQLLEEPFAQTLSGKRQRGYPAHKNQCGRPANKNAEKGFSSPHRCKATAAGLSSPHDVKPLLRLCFSFCLLCSRFSQILYAFRLQSFTALTLICFLDFKPFKPAGRPAFWEACTFFTKSLRLCIWPSAVRSCFHWSQLLGQFCSFSCFWPSPALIWDIWSSTCLVCGLRWTCASRIGGLLDSSSISKFLQPVWTSSPPVPTPLPISFCLSSASPPHGFCGGQSSALHLCNFCCIWPHPWSNCEQQGIFCNTASSTRLFFLFLVQVTGFPGSFEHFPQQLRLLFGELSGSFRKFLLRHTILLGHLLQEFLMLGQSFLGKHQLVLFCLWPCPLGSWPLDRRHDCLESVPALTSLFASRRSKTCSPHPHIEYFPKE